MVVIIAFFGGIRGDHLLMCLFFLCFSTICFGWVTEALSRPDPTSRRTEPPLYRGRAGYYPSDSMSAREAHTRHSRWSIGAPNRPDLLVLGCIPWSGPFQRLGPFFLGTVPYVVIWRVVWDTFEYNTRDLPDGQGPPDFVTVLVISQMVVFSSFAIVQLLQQCSDYGCEKYWWGECLYIILSIISKGLLGGILLTNILLLSTAEVDDVISGKGGGST